ncbi:MAG: aminotransferase class I/II-fold pyridoxal phosphate-dependent enzyme [Desulfobacteraceae bacterium]|nr:aminotransferase class I/II-fold pyridoxal phosphate-dependent enzyme [Desulfobacteraceae bacterium]
MNELAKQLNTILEAGNPEILKMLSRMGKELFFPKGILSQSAEAKQKAYKFNATIGIAKEEGNVMVFPSVMDAINMDFITPDESLTYAPSFGIPALRQAWKDAQYEKNPSLKGKNTSLPIVACGITHAISIVADVWIDPGDVVILPDMMWGNYNMILNVRKGAEISRYPLFSDKGGYNIDAFEKKVKEEAAKRDKIIVLLNFPQNPTGYTATKEEGKLIADILVKVAETGTRVIAVMDDAYFGLFFEDDVMKESIFTLLCDRHENLLAIKLDGATKENFVWGLRVGFITYGTRFNGDAELFYDALERKTAGCVRGNVSNCSHLGQTIVLKSMKDDRYPTEKTEKFNILKARANRVKDVLKHEKYKDAWDVYPFNSGYFMCIRLKNVDAETLRLHLLNNYGVGVIALGEKDIRVAFSCLDLDDVDILFDTVLMGVHDLSH